MKTTKKDTINTDFGIAKNVDGYFMVNGKALHRLVYEKYYGEITSPNNTIHHIDTNPLNNNKINLLAVTPAEHGYLHKLFNIHKNKYPNGVEPLQILDEDSPKIYPKGNKIIYESEYGLFWKNDVYSEPTKICAFAYSLKQLQYLIEISGLYWNDSLIN